MLTPEQQAKAREAQKRYYVKNRAKLIARTQAWRDKNPERRRLTDAARLEHSWLTTSQAPASPVKVDHVELMGALHSAVPTQAKRDERDDCMAEMAMLVLSGQLTLPDLPKAARSYLSFTRRQVAYAHASLDEYVPGTNLTYVDVVRSDTEHF